MMETGHHTMIISLTSQEYSSISHLTHKKVEEEGEEDFKKFFNFYLINK